MKNISMTNRNPNQLIALVAISVAGLFASCATNPPPLPPNNPADPQVRSSSRRPHNLLAPDETTLAIQRQLAATQAYAASAEQMEHGMSNVPGMQHEGTQDHEQMQPQTMEPQKKALSEEMKKTDEEMKDTSQALKEKSEQLKAGAPVYTCTMHPQIHSDKPGNCPICGMKLVPKKEGEHEEH